MQPMWKDRNTARHHGKFALRAALRKARRPSPHATSRRAFVQRYTQKNIKNATSSNATSRTRINRHNTSDVRCEGGVTPCALGVAGSWRRSAAGARRRRGGRSSFRPSSARTAPFCVAITTSTFSESRLSYAPFFRAMLCARAARAADGLRCVHGRKAKEHDARRGV